MVTLEKRLEMVVKIDDGRGVDIESPIRVHNFPTLWMKLIPTVLS
jgi:hypothetical protein